MLQQFIAGVFLLFVTLLAIAIAAIGLYHWHHPFWSMRPGPHFYHEIALSLGLIGPSLIRHETPLITAPGGFMISPGAPESCGEYAELLNSYYAQTPDYFHCYRAEALEERLFHRGGEAITLELRDTTLPYDPCIGFVASFPIKFIRGRSRAPSSITTLFDSDDAREMIPPTTAGIVDLLCVAEPYRRQGLANVLIAGIDAAGSATGRRVHFFEREGTPAPITRIASTNYYWRDLTEPVKLLSAVTLPPTIRIPIHEIPNLLADAGIPAIDPHILSIAEFWRIGVGGTKSGTWFALINPYICARAGGEFREIIAFAGPQDQVLDAAVGHLITLSQPKIKYLIAAIPGSSAVPPPPLPWKFSSQAWTHIYNAIIPRPPGDFPVLHAV